MIVSIIVAMDRNRVIGADGKLPWRLPADLKHFRALTMGKPIVMGRKTHESIGRLLPGRENIVLTRDPDYRPEGCTVLHDLDELYSHCAAADEVMIMGGADLYRQMLDRARRIYLTEVDAEFPGDTFFPDFDPGAWRETARQELAPDADNPHPCSFVTLERNG